jgi:ribosome-binding protein aMBF1 (putative translation factor)
MPTVVGNGHGIRPMSRVRLAAALTEEERKARIAYAIESAMLRRGMTSPQLAAKVGRSRGTVNDWVAKRSTPSLVDLGPLCAALNVKAELFAELRGKRFVH